MRRRTINGEIIEDAQQAKKHFIALRVNDDEMAQIRLKMDYYGYRSVSTFLRDIIFKKKLNVKKTVEVVTDDYLKNRFNDLIYQVNKVGVNYNHIASTYMRQAKERKSDGSPLIAGHQVEDKMDRLMAMTQTLIDEFALMIDIMNRYLRQDLRTNNK